MNAVAWTPGVFRSRIRILQSPPRGTPSRILKTRLGRTCRRSFANHVSASSLSASAATPTPPMPPPGSGVAAAPGEGDEVMVLRNLLLSMPPPTLQHQASPIILGTTARTKTATAAATTADTATSHEHPSRSVAPDRRTEHLFQALRAGDTLAVYNWITRPNIVRGLAPGTRNVPAGSAEETSVRHKIVARLPPVVFSELLRCLDPYAVCEHNDVLQGIAISPSMAQLTPIGTKVSIFGIRTVYTTLLKALLSVCALRAEAHDEGNGLLLNDYIVLMRCAGAASDMDTAKRIWHEMEQTGYVTWRQSELYSEFLRARFLTEDLYTQHDPVRLRVQPVNLHKQKLVLHGSRLRRLDSIRHKAERIAMHRFGQNPNEPDYAEHLTRILRKTKPVRFTYMKAAKLGYAREERLLATVMVALGRTGSIREMGSLLTTYWNVRVWRDKATGTDTVGGGADFARDSPMYPSAVLLDAVVQAYCCNGEIALALKVMTYLSQRYGIVVPDKVWFDLLNWAYAMSSSQVSREWNLAGFPSRTLAPGTVEAIWTTMTSAPYNVQPGFAQYHVLIKTMLVQHKTILPALRLMRQLKPLYQAQLREQEEAMLALNEAQYHRAADYGPAMKRMRQATSNKWYMWFCFHTWCLRILKNGGRAAPGDDLLTRLIPNVVDEFRPFFLRDVWYPTATGMVQLREPHDHPKLVSSKEEVHLPAIRPLLRFQHQDLSQFDMADDESARPAASTEDANEDADENGSAGDEEIIDENGNAVSPAQQRWHERRLVRGVRWRRVYRRRRAIHDYQGLGPLGRGAPRPPRSWLVREFT